MTAEQDAARTAAEAEFPHRNPYLEGGAYMGEERSRLPLRDAYVLGWLAKVETLPTEEQIAEAIMSSRLPTGDEFRKFFNENVARSAAAAVRALLTAPSSEVVARAEELRWEKHWAATPCPWDQTPHERRERVYVCSNCGHAVARLSDDSHPGSA